MTRGPDDRLTAAKHLAAILSIDLRPGGKLEGTIRDDVHFYRFSGVKALPAAVLRWLSEALGHSVESDLTAGEDERDLPPRSGGDEKPCR